jgi:hypothetical protein
MSLGGEAYFLRSVYRGHLFSAPFKKRDKDQSSRTSERSTFKGIILPGFAFKVSGKMAAQLPKPKPSSRRKRMRLYKQAAG